MLQHAYDLCGVKKKKPDNIRLTYTCDHRAIQVRQLGSEERRRKEEQEQIMEEEEEEEKEEWEESEKEDDEEAKQEEFLPDQVGWLEQCE